MSIGEEPKIKSDWWCVKIDETRHWNIAEEDKPFIARISGVYVYARNSHTHLCEMTPSYWLCFVTYVIDYFDGVEVSDEKSDQINQDYALQFSDDAYMHCHDVDQIGGQHHYGEVADAEDMTHEQQENEVICSYSENPVF